MRLLEIFMRLHFFVGLLVFFVRLLDDIEGDPRSDPGGSLSHMPLTVDGQQTTGRGAAGGCDEGHDQATSCAG